VSSPRWSDDELLHELRAALEEAAVDDSIVRAAQAALTWLTVDTDLELLGLAVDSPQANGAIVRGSGSRAPRTLAFHGERLSVEIEIDEAGIVGQLTPPQPGQITLVTADGPQATTQADDVGYFAFSLPASWPVRLDCRLGGDRFITEWVNL
jgi:hypothetical protein